MLKTARLFFKKSLAVFNMHNLNRLQKIAFPLLSNILVFFVRIKDGKIAHIKELTNKTTQILEEKIKNKLISAEENRMEKLNSLTERLKEHVNENVFLFDYFFAFVAYLTSRLHRKSMSRK